MIIKTMQIAKDLLFFSNFCDYSKDVINFITKKNIREKFMFVCVDNRSLALPPFVDRVPMLMTVNKQVLCEDEMMSYIELLCPAAEVELKPFALVSGGGSKYMFTDTFGSLEEERVTDRTQRFTFLGDNPDITMFPSAKSESSEKGKAKFDSSVLEKYMAERDNDIKNLKASLGPRVI